MPKEEQVLPGIPVGGGAALPGTHPPAAQVEQGADEEDHIHHQEGEVQVQVFRREGQEIGPPQGGGEGGKETAPHGNGHEIPQQPGKAPDPPPGQPEQASRHPRQGEDGVAPVQHPPRQGQAGGVVQGEQPHPHGPHPCQGQQVEDGDRRHPPAVLQIPLVPPGGLEHVQQGHLPDGPGAAQAGDQEGHREEQQGEAHRVGVEGEGQVKGCPYVARSRALMNWDRTIPSRIPSPRASRPMHPVSARKSRPWCGAPSQAPPGRPGRAASAGAGSG